MKVYYCFNGLYDYEYECSVENIINAIYDQFNKIIDEKAVYFYFVNYSDVITEYLKNLAYWAFLQETKSDLLDARLIKRLKRTQKEEDRIMYGENYEYRRIRKNNIFNKR